MLCAVLWIGFLEAQPGRATAAPKKDPVLEAQVLVKRGRLAEAKAIYRRIVESSDSVPRDVSRSLQALIKLYRSSALYGDALEMALRYDQFLKQRKGIPARELVQSATTVAEFQFLLGQYSEAEAILEQALAAGNGKLNIFVELDAQYRLAAIAQRKKNQEQLHRRCREVEATVNEALSLIDQRILPAVHRAFFVRSLAACYDMMEKPADGIKLLEELLARPAGANEVDSRTDTLKQLATYHLAAKDRATAAERLRDAIKLQRELKRDAEDDRTLGSLLIALAAVERAEARHAEADQHYDEAATRICRRLKAAERAEGSTDIQLECLEQLAGIYHQRENLAGELEASEKLLDLQTRAFGPNHPRVFETKSNLGNVYGHFKIRQFEKAKEYLSQALTYWQQQDVPEPLLVATALNNLGAVERATGALDDAEGHIKDAYEIRLKHLPPDDVDIAGSLNNLASVHVARGRFFDAIRLYSQVIEICREKNYKDLHSATELNLATAYKSQGDFAKAVEHCEESLRIQEAVFGNEPFRLVPHLNALAALCRSQGDVAESREHADRAWQICTTTGNEAHPTAASTRHHLAVLHRINGKKAEAEELWKAARDIYDVHGEESLAARCENNLGVLAARDHRIGEAETWFRQAGERHLRVDVPPQEQYSTQCNLAWVLHERRQNDEAIRLLEDAIDFIEVPRAETWGAEHERATYFARFAAAFDLLVDWTLNYGQPPNARAIEEAFRFAERGRNRTFLDQLQLAGTDLRTTLDPVADAELLKKEEALRVKLASLGTATSGVARQAGHPEHADEATQNITAVRDEYQEVWTEIRNRSPVYRNLLTKNEALRSLEDVRAQLLTPKNLLLFYYLGAAHSYLIVFGDSSLEPQVHALHLPQEVVRLVVDERQKRRVAHGEGERTVVDTVYSPEIDPATHVLPESPGDSAPLTRSVANVLVSSYRELIDDKQLETRGVVGKVKSGTGEDYVELALALSRVLLPPKVLELIKDRNPDYLIVVPDGALHQLPLEALVLEAGDSPQFVLDELPPIAYAPSANIILNLAARRADALDETAATLTVGDPAYAQEGDEAVALAERSGSLLRELPHAEPAPRVVPRLPATNEECQRVAKAFGREKTQMLLGPNATERNMVAAMPNKRFIHVAAHGLVDDRTDNLFGALLLTPPASDPPPDDNDGFLRLHEIHSTGISGCELAVLSACQTNVGPERPLEAGTTLAQAFLVAGAKRAVASLWRVADESTAELMGSFFENISRDEDQSSYADALHRARQEIRNNPSNPQWSAPYYWAPFVLIGPAER